MARARQVYVPSDEPIVIDAHVIAEFLEQRGMERMAGWVRGVENARKWQAMTEQKLRNDYERVLAKLHVYEPPAPVREPHNPFPPPERSD